MDPQRVIRVRPRRILGGTPATFRGARAAAVLACGAVSASCASVGESPRTAYAVPAESSAAALNDAAPRPVSFAIAERAPALERRAPPAVGVAEPVLSGGRVGLFPAERFELATGQCGDCGVPPAALWWFRDELIAVPRPGSDAGTNPDAARGSAIVWVGSPQRIPNARLSADAREVRVGERSIALALVPQIETNAAYVDGSTVRFFSGRPLTILGAAAAAGAPRFVARALVPEDQRIDLAALHPEPLRPNELLGTLVEAQTNERFRLLFARTDPSDWAGSPAIAFVLTGAQGDDDGSRAGHLAVATGVLGERGHWNDWLVSNFYPLREGNAKGIIPASLPMENYLYDVNSGQLYYRPGYMLVAVLARPRAAQAVQEALQETMAALHCGEIEFDRARRNSTAMTIDPLRGLGWRLPNVGPTSRVAGVVAAPVVALVRRSFRVVGSVYATFAAERTRLLPRVAFEVAGHDLLQLAALGARDRGALTPFERMLAEDIEGLLFVRLPQVPSSRRYGTYPTPSLWAYGAGLMSDPGPYEGAPDAEDRDLPAALRGTCGSGAAGD